MLAYAAGSALTYVTNCESAGGLVIQLKQGPLTSRIHIAQQSILLLLVYPLPQILFIEAFQISDCLLQSSCHNVYIFIYICRTFHSNSDLPHK
jgi:hypothetical protein